VDISERKWDKSPQSVDETFDSPFKSPSKIEAKKSGGPQVWKDWIEKVQTSGGYSELVSTAESQIHVELPKANQRVHQDLIRKV